MNSDQYSQASRGFTIFSGAWYIKPTDAYAPGISDCVTFGFYEADGSSCGEARVLWKMAENPASDDGAPAAVLEIPVGDWNALVHMPEVMTDLLSLHPRLTPEYFCATLEARGFTDRTQRVNPAIQRRYRFTTRYAEDGKPDRVNDYEGVPDFAKLYEPMLSAPNFVKLTISFETVQTIIELVD